MENNTKYKDSFFNEKDGIIKARQAHKQKIKNQISADSKLVVVPNAWASHIDMEMVFLPNGVVLLHSFPETLKLLEQNNSININYGKLYSNIQKLNEQCQPLFNKTKTKLEKRGFIVKEVCGFISTDRTLEGIIAMGFNGVPIVSQDGKIIYTIPPNELWYKDYFSQVLKDSGVSDIYQLNNCQKLELVRSSSGFFRCQTQTIPFEALSPKINQHQ